MHWLSDSDVYDFFQGKNLDIRTSHNGRWIDQKCTPDVVSIVADSIGQFVADGNPQQFSSTDIWHASYTMKYVPLMFKKPNLDDKTARSEYDKFFQQPMEMLAYAGVLKKYKQGNRNIYSIANPSMLEFIARSEQSALTFICAYIDNVVTHSGLLPVFERFFDKQTTASYDELKDAFQAFTIKNTPINKPLECGRIFTKVINPLAYQRGLLGTKNGRISKQDITRDMLMYNRPNFRDILSDKPKAVTRTRREPATQAEATVAYESAKAKRVVRQYNELFRDGRSEMPGDDNHATHIHHIFPLAQFPTIAGYYENLIALTPNQHNLLAHPDNVTHRVDVDYQRKCLLAKCDTIGRSIAGPTSGKIYDRLRFLEVVSIGLTDTQFLELDPSDFKEIACAINEAYGVPASQR